MKTFIFVGALTLMLSFNSHAQIYARQSDLTNLGNQKVDKSNGRLTVTSTNTVFGTNNGIIQDVVESVSASNSIVSGGMLNTNSGGSYSAIVGGYGNHMFSDEGSGPDFSFIGAGKFNTNSGQYSVIGGGFGNFIDGGFSVMFIGGGEDNQIYIGSSSAVIVGGGHNRMNLAPESFIGAGVSNKIDNFGGAESLGEGVVLTGGLSNLITTQIGSGSMRGATIPGGENNIVAGAWSFAAGFNSQALHDGSFVWSDSLGGGTTTGSNQFRVVAHGGLYLDAGTFNGDMSGLSNASTKIATNWATATDGQFLQKQGQGFRLATPSGSGDVVAANPNTFLNTNTFNGPTYFNGGIIVTGAVNVGEIDATNASFSGVFTNAGSIITNNTGWVYQGSNGVFVSSNAPNSTYFNISSNRTARWGSNGVDTVSIVPTTGSITASNFNGSGSGLTNTPFSSLAFTPVTTPFTNIVVGFIRFTNAGIAYAIPVGTNMP